MPGRNFTSSNSYKYGFNGKENDAETGTQDYGMRIYNPALGKFLSVDPLSDSYPWNSTYAFAENDVIRCIDLDGTEKTQPPIYVENKGYTTAIDNTGRAAINDATIKQLAQAMNYKKNVLLQAPPSKQGEIRQGGIQADPDYIATTTNMDNLGSNMVPFYDASKTLIKGGEVTNLEYGIEIVGILPVTKIFGKIGKVLAKTEFADAAIKEVANFLKNNSNETINVIQKRLQKSIDSHTKQIAEHTEFIADPKKKYGDAWDNFSNEKKENIIHHWKQDVKRHEAYKAAKEEVLKEAK
jgi:RHS repeat-associated protein